MKTKKYLYAAVGAQVAVAKSAQAKLETLVSKVNDNATSASSDLQSRINTWAGEGEQFLGKVTDAKAIDELTSRVDFDQMQTQVNKLRDQLEDIVSTWRANFRPETKTVPAKVTTEKVTVTSPVAGAPKATAAKTVTKTTTTRTTAAKKPAAKKPAAKTAAAATTTTAKTTAAKTTAAKTTAAKTTAAKKPVAKKPAAKKATTKAAAAKKPAAKKAS